MQTESQRDMLFVSHANPEDNEFARWLSLRLAREGYPVWCDLTRLLGGEDFWRDIDVAIRTRSIKFLYVLSRASNDINRTGLMKEIAVAQVVAKHVQNFIIPLRIDDLPYDDVNIELKRFNVVDFTRGWAEGFEQLRKLLAENGVPKRSNFSPDAVTAWWQTHFSADAGVVAEPEFCASNWFPITDPPAVWVHRFDGDWAQAKRVIAGPYPFYPLGQLAISFADSSNLVEEFAKGGLEIVDSQRWKVADFGRSQNGLTQRSDAWNALQYLLRNVWEDELSRRGLSRYTLANAKQCFFYKKGQLPKDKVDFAGLDGRSADRQLVGKSKDLSWHYGVEARAMVYPILGYALRPHVVFSADGITPLDSKPQQHRLRRSRCKQWWNDRWRDLLLAFVASLKESEFQTIKIRTGANSCFRVTIQPDVFRSAVRYTKLETFVAEDIPDYDDEAELAEEEADADARAT